jgi:hypothetical protein
MSGSNLDLVNALSGGGLLNSLAHPATVNPLAAYAGATNVANSVWENRLNQARQAAGEAYQQATDPNTGQVDPARAQALIAANPRAALAAQGSATSGQQLQQANTLFNQQQMGAIGRSIGSVLTQPDAQQTPGNYKAMLDYALANHGITQDHYTTALAALQGAGTDPASLRQFGTKLLVGTLAGPEIAQTVLPSNTGINQGNTYQPLVQQPAVLGGGLAKAPGAMPVGLPSASQLIQPTPGPATATGQPTSTTLGNTLRMQGLDQNGNPIPNPAFANLPSALRNPNAPPAVATPIVTGVGPAASSAMATTGQTSSANYQDISNAATKAVGQRAQLQSMLGDASQFTTGPGASTLKDIKATIQRIGATVGTSFGIDANKLASQEDLDKVANQLADAQGANSDARLAVNQGANPSSHNTPAGLRLILNKLIGNSDFLAAKGALAAQYQRTQDPQGVNARTFADQVNQQLDPRVFQFNRMDQDQQRQYLTELGAGKDAFKQKYIQMRSMGVLPGG